MEENSKKLPIIYACAGCSGAGQIAYKFALKLDKENHVEMSCLAGLASGKKNFLNKVKARPIWIIDGCPIECAKTILTNMNLKEDKHVQLHKLGIKKNQDPDSGIDFEILKSKVLNDE